MDHVWAMLGIYGAYVRLLDAMLGPYSGHVELILIQEQHIPFNRSNFEGVTRWKLLGYRFPLGVGFRG